MVKQLVEPIKDFQQQKQVEDTLLHHFKQGRRNYTIWRLGMKTLLRVGDVLALKYSDVYDTDGKVKHEVTIHDEKTKKLNTLRLYLAEDELNKYHDWLVENGIKSEYLFPSSQDTSEHVSKKMYYKVMHTVGDWLGMDNLGTHSMRKTGAYRFYEANGHELLPVMKMLNHSSQEMTMAYLGLDKETMDEKLSKVNWG